ncbi:zinc finger protein 862-like [Mercenaria mercenaria]|uniref:zinc finger protein 862-like n=1 Tax=Mercenaria mercenaria TaxID=6596 RepID=UPI00234E6F04|nr:zinc finger protein 862-like [Mercenaria mercenaria]
MWRFLDGVSEPIAKKPKTKQEQLETQRLYDKTKRKRNFQDSWKSEYSWLKCDDESVGMVCTVCVKFEESGSFVTGCTNFKIQTIKKHAMSESHCQNTRKSEARSSSTSTASERSLSMLNSAAINKLRILFCNAHYIAKLGRPYSDYVHLCKLDRGNKQLDIGHTYTTDKYCQVFVRSIADTIRQTQKDHISNSKFISVISDGSTDCSSKEAECIMLRSAAAGKVLTQFIGLKHVAKADSEQISRAIIETLNERIGDTWEEKLLAVGCDGASVMLGVKNGVVQKLRQHTNKPKTFSIHCSAHRLELSFKDAMKQVPAKVHQKCEALLLNIYLFYKYSPLNRANLKVSFETLGEKMVIPTRVGGTRWLPHTRRALKHLLMGKTAIIQHLEQIQNPNDSSHRKESAAKAKNYLKLLKEDQVVVWLHFLMDVVSCLSKVSEVIQEKNSTLADVWNELQSAKVIMMRYQDRKLWG